MNGHIQRRGPTTFRYHYSVHGEKATKTLQGSKREVEREAARIYAAELAAWEANRPKAPKNWTVADLLLAWLKDKTLTLENDRTKWLYRYMVETVLIPTLGDVPLAEYSSQHLLAAKEALMARFGSVNTVLLHWARLVQAERWAVRHGYLVRSPAALIEMPSPASTAKGRYLLPEALKLDAALEPPLGLAVALGLWAGLRIGEVRGVQKADIDPAGVLHVRRQLARYDNAGAKFHGPKHGSSRDVEINGNLARHIEAQLDWLDTRTVRRIDDLLVVNEAGEPFGAVTIYDYLHRLQERLGLPRLVFHGLRHSYATLCREAGIPDLEIAASLGHTTTRMLVQLYGAHPDPERHARMASRMDQLVSRATVDAAGQESDVAN